ncbi:MAG TPA: tetratricopeptide repeat protein [Pyrinomonadaceae bacterium]|jgi:tetratricopeptide (TPR) repeat protein
MPAWRRKLFIRDALNLAIFIPFIFIFIFGVQGASADGIVPLAERPTNPRSGCRARTGGTPRHNHHAERQAATTIPNPLPSATPDPAFEVEVYIFLGNEARDAAKYEEANRHYRQVLTIKPNEWRAHYGLGNVLFDQALLPDQSAEAKQSLMTRAVEEYLRAAQLSVEDREKEDAEVSELYSDLAQAYLHLGDRTKAQEAVNRAIELNPRSASATRRLGNIYFVQRNYDEAIRKYCEALQIEPDNALTHRALGAAYYASNNTERALNEFKEVVRLRPDYVKGYEDIGRVYFDRRSYRDAIEPFRKALELNPRLLDARYNLALSYCQSGDKASAQRESDLLRQSDPARASQLNNRIQNCEVRRP